MANKKNVEVNNEELDFTIDTEELQNVAQPQQAPQNTQEPKYERVHMAERGRDTDSLMLYSEGTDDSGG